MVDRSPVAMAPESVEIWAPAGRPHDIHCLPPPIHASRARDFIEAHLGEAISIQALLGACGGESQFQLIREFKRSFGLPPHAYQLSRRVGRARDLLAAGMAPAEVAIELGFADQSHFARHFKRALGVSPGQYFRHALTA